MNCTAPHVRRPLFLTVLKGTRIWHPQESNHVAWPLVAPYARHAVLWSGAVIRNVVARGGWVDVGALVWQESLGTLSQASQRAAPVG